MSPFAVIRNIVEREEALFFNLFSGERLHGAFTTFNRSIAKPFYFKMSLTVQVCDQAT
jgi:hypothetical protein